MIEFKDVSYIFPDNSRGLDKVSFNILPGEQVALVGNNGSGKTTLALLINGILKPSEGKVLIKETSASNRYQNQELKSKVGLVFQNPDNQLVASTVEREIAFSLENSNIPRDIMRQKVTQILQLFALMKYRNRLTAELSGGEKQRLALAAVMVTEPEVLILDEPESYLDETGKKLLEDAINRLLELRRNLTLIRISQYAAIASKYERMIVLSKGRVFLDGKPDAIYLDYDLCRSAGIEVPLKYRLKSVSPHLVRKSDSDAAHIGIADKAKTIYLENISFKYDSNMDDYQLSDVSLDLRSDKVYGLVGPTGSGKSTLLQVIAGLLRPATGRLRYAGFKNVPGSIAISFQQPERQFFLDTVDKELKFGPSNLKAADVERLADNCYELICLDKSKFATRDPFSLSGGEKRRLAFGTALSVNPLFILFDEPTCGLDEPGQRMFRDFINRLSRKGIGIIIASHHGDIIFELADEILRLDKGRLLQSTDKLAFFQSREYAGFLSEPELLAYQIDNFGIVKHYSLDDLLNDF